MAELIEISKLKPHPRNNDFFDDLSGDTWTDFLESIKTSGVIEAITITGDNTIISGHQRTKACKELGIEKIPYSLKVYTDSDNMTIEDAILLDLIDANLKQRGGGNPNSMKLAKCIKELERIYNISHGGDRKSNVDNPPLTTQADIAAKLGLTQDQYKSVKKLLDAIPEFQEAVEAGKLSPTTVFKILAKLPLEEQRQFLEKLGIDKITSMTGAETKEELAKLKNQNKEMQKDFEADKKELLQEIESLRNQEPVEPVTVEVIPEDYTQLKEELAKVKTDLIKKDLLLESLKEDEVAEREQSLSCDAFNEHCITFNTAIISYMFSEEKCKNLKTKDINKYIKSIEHIETTLARLKTNFEGVGETAHAVVEQKRESKGLQNLRNQLKKNDSNTVKESV